MSKTDPEYVLRAQLITQVLIARYGEELGRTSIMETHIRCRDDGRVYGVEIDNARVIVDEIIKAAKR